MEMFKIMEGSISNHDIGEYMYDMNPPVVCYLEDMFFMPLVSSGPAASCL